MMPYPLVVLGGLIMVVSVWESPLCDPKVSNQQSIVTAIAAGLGICVFAAGLVQGLS